jgi:hypothetical protein
MKSNIHLSLILLVGILAQGCDRQIPQTVVVHADNSPPVPLTLRLVESNQCEDEGTSAGWSSNGLWIFRTTSIRGGVGAVTQELSICVGDSPATSNSVWHTIHGGGSPLLVLACDFGGTKSCKMYQDGYELGAWSQDN